MQEEFESYLVHLLGKDCKTIKATLREAILEAKEQATKWENFHNFCYIVCKFDSGNIDVFGIVRSILDQQCTKSKPWKKTQDLVNNLRKRDNEWKTKIQAVSRLQTLRKAR